MVFKIQYNQWYKWEQTLEKKQISIKKRDRKKGLEMGCWL